MSKGTVVEFDLNKHTTLGVIDGHKVKAKGGLRYEIKTSDGKLHAGIKLWRRATLATSPLLVPRTIWMRCCRFWIRRRPLS